MSYKKIRVELETVLRANILDVAIKKYNSGYYTLNGVQLSELEIQALKVFIQPSVIRLGEKREIFGSINPYRYEIFYQVEIYEEVNTGTNNTESISERLSTLFKEEIYNDVVSENIEPMGSFLVGEKLVTPFKITAHYFGV